LTVDVRHDRLSPMGKRRQTAKAAGGREWVGASGEVHRHATMAEFREAFAIVLRENDHLFEALAAYDRGERPDLEPSKS